MANLSIIVPVYNVCLYVSECIYSLLNQSYDDFEIIIVDDGSTDESPEIVDRIAQKDNRIKVIHQKNLGLPEARNTGIKAATGKYIGFIDSDDRIKPDMYKVLINKIEFNDCDLAICNFSRFSKSSFLDGKRYSNKLITYNDQYVCDYYSYILDSSCNKLYKLEIINRFNICFENKTVVPQEDFYFLLKYIAHIEKICTIRESNYDYRIRSSSISNSKQPINFMQYCYNFVDLVSKYHTNNKIMRDTTVFEFYLLIEMMQAVINTIKPDKLNQIEGIVLYFSKHKYFNKAISFYLKRLKSNSKSSKNIYNIILFSLYKFKLYNIASKLELLRLNRFRRNSDLDFYYE